MNATMTTHTWQEDNQRYLSTALDVVRHRLERHLTTAREGQQGEDQSAESQQTSIELDALQNVAACMSAPPALETLCMLFGLSPFERDIVLLCAGGELSSSFASLWATLQGEGAHSYPTFGLA